LVKRADGVLFQFVPSHIVHIKMLAVSGENSLLPVKDEIGGIYREVWQKYALDLFGFGGAFHIVVSAFRMKDAVGMRDIKQFHFPVQATRHKNILLWVKIN